MTETAALPTWDVRAIFPALDSAEFGAAQVVVARALAGLGRLYDHHGVRGGPASPPAPKDLAAFDEVTTATNALLEQVRTLSAYLHAFVTTDARNDKAATLYSRLQADLAELAKLTTRFEAWV